MSNALDALFPPNRITREVDDLAHWGSDRTTAYQAAPSAVVFPETLDEVVALVRLANAEGFQLVPSGGRTGLSGGAVAQQGEVVVSFDRMNRILGFDAAERLAHCQAGVATGALQAFAEERGLFYPVDFASSGSSQIGGNIATNAGGIRVIRYGLTRDWVAGLTVVTGTGDVLRCNNGLVKNATGYDFRHLFIGSEGTLGLVVEAEVRLANPPEPQRVMVLGCPAFEVLFQVLSAFQQDLTLSAFEFFSDLALAKVRAARGLPAPLAEACPFYALLEFDQSDLEAASGAFEHCLEQGWVADGVLKPERRPSGKAMGAARGDFRKPGAADALQKRCVRAPQRHAEVSASRRRPHQQGLPGVRGVLVRPHRRRQPAPEHPQAVRLERAGVPGALP